MPRHMSVDEVALARALRLVDPKMDVRVVTRKVAKFRKDRDPSAKGPSAAAVSRLLNRQSFEKPKTPKGRTRDTTAAEDAKLPGIVDRLEKANPDANVTGAMIREVWKTKKKTSERLPRRRLGEMGKPWRPALRKPRVTPENKEEAFKWGKAAKKQSIEWWKTKVLAMDGCTFSWQTSAAARKQARAMKKRGSFRSKGDGLKYAVPSRKKHRAAARSHHVVAAMGAGKMRVWVETEGWNTEQYILILRHHLPKARKVSGTTLLIMRDNDPKAFHPNGRGVEAERRILGAGSVLPLPKYRSHLMPLDYSGWDLINRKMAADYPGDDESFEDWKARLKRTALSLEKEEIDDIMGSMYRRVQELVRTKGEWTKND